MHTVRNIIVTFLVLLLIVTLWGLINFIFSIPDDRPVVPCTDDAKLCLDGSTVGRVWPSCEFAKCPGE